MTITRKVQILADLTAAADVLGLPSPCGITVPDGTDRVFLQLDRLADVAQWAVWLETCVDEADHGNYHHHRAEGHTYGLRVELLAVEPIAQPVRFEVTDQPCHLQAVR